jgi:hypothetical protein
MGVLKGRSKKAILLGCPLLLQLWWHERFIISRPVVSLQPYEALPEGLNPADRFTMDSLWCLRMVISYLSLSICLSILFAKFTFRVHISFVCKPCTLTSRQRGHTRILSVSLTL